MARTDCRLPSLLSCVADFTVDRPPDFADLSCTVLLKWLARELLMFEMGISEMFAKSREGWSNVVIRIVVEMSGSLDPAQKLLMFSH